MLAIISGITAPGEACGGDLSNAMLQEARRRADTAGASHLRFETMDMQALQFPDYSFDRVLATQLLVHVPDPRGAMHEICCVTAARGLVAIADTDWDTLVVGCTHKELGCWFTRLFSDGVRNGLIVRDYCGWLSAEGFSNIKIIPQPIVFDEWTFVRDWIMEPSLPHFVAQGSMSAAEAETLVDDLAHRNAQGQFFAAFSFYTITGQRP